MFLFVLFFAFNLLFFSLLAALANVKWVGTVRSNSLKAAAADSADADNRLQQALM